MTAEFDDCIYQLVERENVKSDNRFDLTSLSQLSKPDFKNQVKDSARVFQIAAANRNADYIITLSNAEFPDSVADAVTRVKSILEMLDDELRQVVIQPTLSDSWDQRSYAFWPRKKTISNHRFIRKAQILSINRSVINWISDLARSTRSTVDSSSDIQRLYHEPLQFVLADSGMPDSVKKAAESTLESLDKDHFKPLCVAQHGDFWHGNLLLDNAWPASLLASPAFYVIDWGGARTRGYPFIDVLRYLMSTGDRDRQLMRGLKIYQQRADIPLEDILRYACTHAGKLGMNRGEFPLQRYYASVDRLIQKASRCKS